MKKIKLLLPLIIMFLFIGSVKADSIETFKRDESNNYGVNKKWKIDDKMLEYIKQTDLVDASKKIYDYSDILTDEEEKTLYDSIIPLIEEYKMDIVILTYSLPYTNDRQNEDFACDFYDFNDFGIDFTSYSGVLFFRNTYENDPYFDMYSFGEAQLYFTPSRMSNILDMLYDNVHNKLYFEAFNNWLYQIRVYHNYGKVSGYFVDENSILRKNFNPLIGFNIFLTSIITFIFIIVNVKKNKMVYYATDASKYLNKSTFKLTKKIDKLISSHVTSWVESSSSSSGGGHSSIGHSGGGHSSGGGRHG